MYGSSQRLPPAHLSGGFNGSGFVRFSGAGGETRTLMRSEPRQILSLVRIPISPLRLSSEGPIDASRHIRGSQYGRQLRTLLETATSLKPTKSSKSSALPPQKNV